MRPIPVIVCVLALAAPASATQGPRPTQRALERAPVHDFAAGEPGNPREPAILVTITMQETYDGKMLFAPDTITVPTGGQVRFVLRNLGQVDHSFAIGASGDDAPPSPSAKGAPPNARYVPAATTGDLLWRFTKPGRFGFASTLPGQAAAGMKGTVVVGEADE